MRKGVIISSFLVVLLALSLVSAFGVSSPYWKGNDMPVYAGMNSQIELNLQNGAGATQDVVATMQVIVGKDIASLPSSEYTVKAGQNVDVPLNIQIPNDAAMGKSYTIEVDVKTKAPGQAGAVAMGTGMLVAFNVVVGEKPKAAQNLSSLLLYLDWIIIIIAIAVVLWIILRKKKGRKKK